MSGVLDYAQLMKRSIRRERERRAPHAGNLLAFTARAYDAALDGLRSLFGIRYEGGHIYHFSGRVLDATW